MGWIFILLGVFVIAIGSFLIYYGQDLVRKEPETRLAARTSVPPAGGDERPQMPILDATQEKVLRVLFKIQSQHGARKLIVIRETTEILVPTEDDSQKASNLSEEMWGPVDSTRAQQLERLMEDLPAIYVERLSESRWGNPFVVRVTEEGIRYLRNEF